MTRTLALAVVTDVSNLVLEGSIAEAETSLMVLADREGDLILSEVIAAMPPRDTVAILREYDTGKGSVIASLITPQQFLAAVVLEAKYNEPNNQRLVGMIDSVVLKGESDPDDFIDVLGASDGGLLALADYFSDRHEEIEQFFLNGDFPAFSEDHIDLDLLSDHDLLDGEMGADLYQPRIELDEVAGQDWKELAWRLRCDHYEVFCDVLRILRGRLRSALEKSAVASARKAAHETDDEDDEDSVL
jgi:hypothetical protein